MEFKYRNISGVLDELGLPWIPGYKPAKNFQDAIFGAIERYLNIHPGILESTPASAPAPGPAAAIFVDPPELRADRERSRQDCATWPGNLILLSVITAIAR